MKVLKHGDPKYWKHLVLCNGFGYAHKGCGALLLAEGEDLGLRAPHGLFGAYNVSIHCPDCGRRTEIQNHRTPVKARIVPDGILRKLKTEYYT